LFITKTLVAFSYQLSEEIFTGLDLPITDLPAGRQVADSLLLIAELKTK